jgi:hypothetical protein
VVLKHAVGATFPVNFALGFYKVLLGGRLSMEDLAVISPPLVKAMETVCLMDENLLEDMYMDFTTDLFKVTKIKEGDNESERIFTKNYELCANGSQKSVSSANRVEYLRDCIMTHLCCVSNKETENALRELAAGFRESGALSSVRFSSANELQSILNGTGVIQLDDWMQHTDVTGVSAANLEVVTWLWDVVADMDEAEKRALLKYVTGSSLLPAGGFKDLFPRFTVVVTAANSQDDPPRALPNDHKLLIPRYFLEDKLRSNMKLVIKKNMIANFLW